jgi:hypothetical protein
MRTFLRRIEFRIQLAVGGILLARAGLAEMREAQS